MSEKYPKIQSIYKRDEATNFRTFTGEFALPVFEQLQNMQWVLTEKIDGMNMRAIWNERDALPVGEEVTWQFRGRTDRAQVPGDLGEHMAELFADGVAIIEVLEDVLGIELDDKTVCIYGEGFGGSIQKGQHEYGPEKRFIMFDICIDGRYVNWQQVVEFGYSADIMVVDCGQGSMGAAAQAVRKGFISEHGGLAEGYVLRPHREMTDEYGNRIIAKVKTRDFKHG